MDRRVVIACVIGAGLFGAGLIGANAHRGLPNQFLNLNGEQPPGYSAVAVAQPGKLVFISGRGGKGSDGQLPPDFETQTKNTFEDLSKCLQLAGATFKDVVKINYYVTDLGNTAKLRSIRAHYLDATHPPAATLVQVGLGGGALVEIEAVAQLPQ